MILSSRVSGCLLMLLVGCSLAVAQGPAGQRQDEKDQQDQQDQKYQQDQKDRNPQTRGPLLLAVEGRGDQVYRCEAGGWGPARPDAVLVDEKGVEVGSHGAGPFWRLKDGSVVQGEPVKKTVAPAAGDVPWLVLRASAHEGEGLLSQAATIERTQTHGGVAPASGCDAGHLGVEARVAYTATYSFYGKP